MNPFFYLITLTLLFIIHLASAQDLVITQGEDVWVYHYGKDGSRQSRITSRTYDPAPTTARPTPTLDQVVYSPQQLSNKLPVSSGFDFFQGLQSPHDPSVWVYLEREQIGAGYRLVLFNRESGGTTPLLATDNAQRQELAFKPIAWTDQSDELYVEGLFLDSSEEHEGLWIYSLSTRTMRPVPLPFSYLRTPLLSPDRQTFIVTGTLDETTDPVHGHTDVVYEYDLAKRTHETIVRQAGQSLVVEGWDAAAVSSRAASDNLRVSALNYYLPWDAGVALCVSRHGTPGPVGPHNYVEKCNYFAPGGQHGYAAVDFATSLSSDQNVRASAAGTVTFAGISGSLTSGYGRLVIIRHSDGTRTYYAHNKQLLVSEGQAVGQGQVIAREGTTGGSTGDHIHFEWRAAGGNVPTKGSFTDIGEPRQDYRYRSNNTTVPSDTEAPTTVITAPGGTTPAGDFTVNFTDRDNGSVTQRFYQVLEKYGDHWYANRGNGFFNDNFGEFYAGYTRGSGAWSISDKHLRQTDLASTNTSLTTFLSQASGQPYLYEFAARVISTTGPRKFGMHVMADGPTLSQRGNSYLVWFNGEQNQVIIYETIDNQLYTRTTANVAIDNQWANYKITYNPASGALEAFRNNQSLVRWTDSSPIATGSSVSLRTNATAVEFDDLKVYKARESSATVTVGSEVTNDLRTVSGKIKSLVSDPAGNWSVPGNLDVTVASAAARYAASAAESASPEVSVYPNPTDGTHVTLRYQAESERLAQVQVLDLAGRLLKVHQEAPRGKGPQSIVLDHLFQNLAAGSYFVQLQQDERVATTRITKQ